MFYKPGAAIQKNLAEADGSRDNLPPPADANHTQKSLINLKRKLDLERHIKLKYALNIRINLQSIL